MNRHLILAAAAAGLLAAPAGADPRVASHFYTAGEIVVVHGRTGLQSTIAFAPDERIENVAVGDAAAWEVVPNKRADLLFVRPVKAGAHTNMTVVTDQHTYLFDLVTAPAQPVYLLTFTYPPKPPAPEPAPSPALAESDPTPPPAEAPPAPSLADLDFNWSQKGARQLLPARVYDDGQSTYLVWADDQPLPAILTRAADGTEGPVNYSVHNGTIVVDGVPATLVLRSGKQVATLVSGGKPAAVAAARQAPPVRASLPESSSTPVPIRFPAQTASREP